MDKIGGVSTISVGIFLSHSAEIFRRGIVYCCINFGNRKGLDKKGGSFKLFRRKIYVSVPRIFVGESFTVALISGIEKVWIGRGGGSIKIFHRKFFVSQWQKVT